MYMQTGKSNRKQPKYYWKFCIFSDMTSFYLLQYVISHWKLPCSASCCICMRAGCPTVSLPAVVVVAVDVCVRLDVIRSNGDRSRRQPIRSGWYWQDRVCQGTWWLVWSSGPCVQLRWGEETCFHAVEIWIAALQCDVDVTDWTAFS